jgi:hypothetical protein
MQMACHILLEISQYGLSEFSLIGGLYKKLGVSKMMRVPILGILGFSIWESQEK